MTVNNETRKQFAKTMVVNLIGEKLSDKWWDSPNRAFNSFTPNELWEKDSKTVMNYLMNQIYGGNFS